MAPFFTGVNTSSGPAYPLRDILLRMPLGNRSHRISLFCIFCALSSAAAVAQFTHYSVKLEPDFERQLLWGDETIEFQADAGEIEWQKQGGLRVVSANIANGEVTVGEQAMRVRLRSGGRHSLKLKYTAAAGRGIQWFAGAAPHREDSQDSGFAPAFYCVAWFACDNSPGQRATLRLDVVIPSHAGRCRGFEPVGS